MSTVELPNIFLETDYTMLCEKWSAEASTQDPITLDNIPEQYLLRLRIKSTGTNAVLMCRDVRSLKELLERSNFDNKQFIDPVTRFPFTDQIKTKINEHPYSQTFDTSSFILKLQRDRDQENGIQVEQDYEIARQIIEPVQAPIQAPIRAPVQIAQQASRIPSLATHCIDGMLIHVDELLHTRPSNALINIPQDIHTIFIMGKSHYPPITETRARYNDLLAEYMQEKHLMRSYFNTCAGAYIKLKYAVRLNYITEITNILCLLQSKQWTLTRAQLDELEYYAWRSVNPLELINKLRTNSIMPSIYMYMRDPNPVPLIVNALRLHNITV